MWCHSPEPAVCGLIPSELQVVRPGGASTGFVRPMWSRMLAGVGIGIEVLQTLKRTEIVVQAGMALAD